MLLQWSNWRIWVQVYVFSAFPRNKRLTVPVKVLWFFGLHWISHLLQYEIFKLVRSGHLISKFWLSCFTKIFCNSSRSSNSVASIDTLFQKITGDNLSFFFLQLDYIYFHSHSSLKNKSLPSYNLSKSDNQFQIPSFKGLFPGTTSIANTFYFVSFCPWLLFQENKVLYNWSH